MELPNFKIFKNIFYKFTVAWVVSFTLHKLKKIKNNFLNLFRLKEPSRLRTSKPNRLLRNLTFLKCYALSKASLSFLLFLTTWNLTFLECFAFFESFAFFVPTRSETSPFSECLRILRNLRFLHSHRTGIKALLLLPVLRTLIHT